MCQTLLSRSERRLFWTAVADDDIDCVKTLLDQHPELVRERYFGVAWKPEPVEGVQFTNTALHTTAVNSQVELAKLLIENGADVDAIGYEENKGLTPPIVLAAWEGSVEMLRLLLDAGADPNLAASAETALYCATEHDAAAKVELLLERDARHDVFTAAILGEVELVKQFVTAYPPLIHARSLKRNRTAREEAQHFGQEEIVQLLSAIETDL